MLRLLDADPRSRMPGGASRLWALVISAVLMAGTALPMVMSSDTADPVDSAAPAEVAQFAAAEEAVTPAEAASGAVDVAPARVAVAPPAVPTTSSQLPAKSPPKTLLPPPPSPRPPQAPPPSPETLLEKQKRLEKEAKLLEQERKKLQEEHERLQRQAEAEAEAVRQRQRKMHTAMRDICLRKAKGSNLYIAPFCPLLYRDSKPVVRVDDAAYEIKFVIPGLRKEDLTISVSDSGNVLHIIGRTTNDHMDVWVARAVQLYADADWERGLDITHIDGKLSIRVSRRSSATQTRPMWSTWKLDGPVPKRLSHWNPFRQSYGLTLDFSSSYLRSYLRGRDWQYLDERYKSASIRKLWANLAIPDLQWSAQAPADALNWWLAEYDVLNQHVNIFNETQTALQSMLASSKPRCNNGDSQFHNDMCLTSGSYGGSYVCSCTDFSEGGNGKKLNDALMPIDRHLTKVISNIEQSGGYNIIVDTSKILEGQGTITYAIEDGVLSLLPELGGGSTGYTLRLLGIWGAKNMNITRKDGLDVIFIPFENVQ